MSTELLSIIVVASTVAVVAALFGVMWRERTSPRTAQVAIIAGVVLAAWATLTMALASGGFFLQGEGAPPVGVVLALVLIGLAASLAASGSLRSLLTNQANLIRLNVWRLIGLVFLLLMIDGQMPALWALPAGIGDVIVGGAAFWVASQLDRPNGTRRAVMFNLFGLADLVVAVGLGIMTAAGPTQVFQTTPTSELATRFPLVLVPAFLVPLAVMLHLVSLWQLLGLTWAPRSAATPAAA
jgi:hypothetical protein